MDYLEDEDGMDLGEGLRLLANAITPVASIPGTDATGTHVDSLTEAVMGLTAAMVQIAEAIRGIHE